MSAAWNSAHHARHQREYLERKKTGLKPVPPPWDWLTLLQVQKLAAEAFRLATHQFQQEPGDPETDRTFFAEELVDSFRLLVAEAAAKAGMPDAVCGCPATEPFLAHVAELRKQVVHWRPQYPVYQKVTPASATWASPGFPDGLLSPLSLLQTGPG